MVIRTRAGDHVELYAFQLTQMVRWGYQGLRNLRPSIGDREVRGIPAINRAARLRAEAVASLGLYCWRGRGPSRQRVETCWQARLFNGKPNPVQTRFGFWETVEESLCFRGNAYIWKNTDRGRVVEWWALHPDQVEFRPQNLAAPYRVQASPGFVDPTGQGPGVYDVDDDTILHVRGHGQGGQLEAPSPVEVFRDALYAPVGRQRHENRMWRRGTGVQLGIEFPAGVSKEQADQWREAWRSNMEGSDGETTAVVGGGAKIQKIGLTPADAQFVDMAALTIQDAALIMGVPANLLGSTGAAGHETRADLEQELMEWLRFGLGPGLERIEGALVSDDTLFSTPALLGTDASGSLGVYPGFDTDRFVRGDLMTEATILQGFVQSGVLLPNEARQQLGYSPHPDGDVLQITPVGGAPNPIKPVAPLGKPEPGE